MQQSQQCAYTVDVDFERRAYRQFGETGTTPCSCRRSSVILPKIHFPLWKFPKSTFQSQVHLPTENEIKVQEQLEYLKEQKRQDTLVKTRIFEEKCKRIKYRKMEVGENARKSFLVHEKQTQEHMAFLMEQKHRDNLVKSRRFEEKCELMRYRKMGLDEIAKKKREEMLRKQLLKDINSATNREMRQNDEKTFRENQRKIQYDEKMIRLAERANKENNLKRALAKEQKENAIKRQKRVERFREGLPARIEKRKEHEARIWIIVRKYAMRWLNRVRQRLKREANITHQTIWNVSHRGGLKNCIKYLYQQSGYVKLDDVVANILKFKEALKKQMLLEEEEEEEDEDEG